MKQSDWWQSMKVVVRKDNSNTRKIGSAGHNKYVAEGINPHKETHVAPSSLLQPFDVTLQERILDRYTEIEKLLRRCLEIHFSLNQASYFIRGIAQNY